MTPGSDWSTWKATSDMLSASPCTAWETGREEGERHEHPPLLQQGEASRGEEVYVELDLARVYPDVQPPRDGVELKKLYG